MSPAPPQGILVLPFSTLKPTAPALAHPSRWHGVVALTPGEFKYAFVNTFSEDEAAAAYERYAVPETGQIFHEGGFANFRLHPPTEVHFHNQDRAPLLIVGATEDHIVPASLSQAQYRRYEHSPARTDYLELEDRPHLHMVAADWPEAAAAIDSWLDGVLDAPLAATERAT
jgi:alpha-beta hydrolase superfamily lysophospholipase